MFDIFEPDFTNKKSRKPLNFTLIFENFQTHHLTPATLNCRSAPYAFAFILSLLLNFERVYFYSKRFEEFLSKSVTEKF